VRKKSSKNCQYFWFFLVCSHKYRYLVLSQICQNLPNDDILKILHLLLWTIATSPTNENSLKKHWSAPIPMYTFLLLPFQVRPPLQQLHWCTLLFLAWLPEKDHGLETGQLEGSSSIYQFFTKSVIFHRTYKLCLQRHWLSELRPPSKLSKWVLISQP
jgi:hypothetical protein